MPLHPTLGIAGMGAGIFDHYDDWKGIAGSYKAEVRDANHSMIHRTIPLSKEVSCVRDESRYESLIIPSNVTKSFSSWILSSFYLQEKSNLSLPKSPLCVLQM